MIESRDPFDSNDAANFYELAHGLAKEGNDVTFFLVQNGVFPARTSCKSTLLADLISSGIAVLADDFSLQDASIGAVYDVIRNVNHKVTSLAGEILSRKKES